MPKEFYTERDIEDLVKRGILSLLVHDNVVLTDLAYEKANRLGMRLVHDKPEQPPAAPVRPYLAQQPPGPAARSAAAPAGTALTPSFQPPVPAPSADGGELHLRIRSAVLARLGSQVDPHLLDVIITRVLQNTGVK